MALGGKHSLPGFEQSLEELRADILLMVSLVRRSLSNAKTGFVLRDEDDCSAVIADDEELDLLVKQLDRGGTKILISFQPLATDFRTVLASIKLGSHLENISDHACEYCPTRSRVNSGERTGRGRRTELHLRAG